MICDGNIRPGITARKSAVLPAFLQQCQEATIYQSPAQQPGGPKRRAAIWPGLVLVALSAASGFQAARLIDRSAGPHVLMIEPIEVSILRPAE